MSLKTIAAKVFANIIYNKTRNWAQNPIETQQKVFKKLLFEARNTHFGIDHNFNQIKTSFKKMIT